MRNHKFNSEANATFASTLSKRVNQYFTDNNISKNANTEMVIKTISALAIYLIPFLVFCFAGITNVFILCALWIIMGCGKAFIGTAVMHDSLHGSYSKSKFINNLIGSATWLIGVDANNWKIQHNVLHHSFTNVEHTDEDIEPKFVFRFSPNQPKFWIHRFQHIYAFIFYGIATFQWALTKDFIKVFKYKREGLIKPGAPFLKCLGIIILRKIVYFSVIIAAPIYFLEYSAGLVFGLFFLMHFTAGVLLSFLFQCAHVLESVEFNAGEEDLIDENRLVHQLRTTANFGQKSGILFWFSAGLNHQIEHHLFPYICHIHYRHISKIVKETANEFNIPYHSYPSFGSAIWLHLKTLRNFGRA